MKDLIYQIEYYIVVFLFAVFRALPLDISSWIGSKIGPFVGQFFSANRTALDNLSRAFPENTLKQNLTIRDNMWAHLGRVAAEFSSLPGTRLSSRVTVFGAEYLPKKGDAVLFFSGHVGNWEMLYPMGNDRGVPIGIIYRHINNPLIDKLVANMRKNHATTLVAKGIRGSVQLIKALKRGESLAMLVDQKMNNGIAIPFFGRNAMTSTAVAELALKYNIPIVPTRIIRTHGANFDGHIYPPLVIEKTENHAKDVENIMKQINAILEEWIRAYPEQWFWVHKRWPKEI